MPYLEGYRVISTTYHRWLVVELGGITIFDKWEDFWKEEMLPVTSWYEYWYSKTVCGKVAHIRGQP